MAIASEPSEEEDAIIHGTTLEAANAIFAQRKFAERETWFASMPILRPTLRSGPVRRAPVGNLLSSKYPCTDRISIGGIVSRTSVLGRTSRRPQE
jgi:hypothetical protein